MYFGSNLALKFPNAVVLNAVGCRNAQMSAKERKYESAKERKRDFRGSCRGATRGAQWFRVN